MGYDDILAKGIDGALERQGAEKYKGHHGSHREAGGVEFLTCSPDILKSSRAEAEDPVSAEHIDQA